MRLYNKGGDLSRRNFEILRPFLFLVFQIPPPEIRYHIAPLFNSNQSFILFCGFQGRPAVVDIFIDIPGGLWHGGHNVVGLIQIAAVQPEAAGRIHLHRSIHLAAHNKGVHMGIAVRNIISISDGRRLSLESPSPK